MLETALNKLWIARLEKPNYQEETKSRRFQNLIIQPTLYKKMSGFLANKETMLKRIEKLEPKNREKIKESWSILF